MNDIKVTNPANTEQHAMIEGNWCGEYQAVIINGNARLYTKDFPTEEAAIEWATDHLSKTRLIADNIKSLSWGGSVRY
jgi:hypothetical protein